MQYPMEYNKFGYVFDQGIRNGYGIPQRHSGVDLNWGNGRDDLGKEVVSPIGGKVIYAMRAGSWGNLVVIRHDLPEPFIYESETINVFWSRFGHLDSINVKLHDVVKEGQKIGTCGGTGYSRFSYSPHLHFDIIKKHLGEWTNYTSWWSSAKCHEYYADPIKFINDFQKFEEAKKKVIHNANNKQKTLYNFFKGKGYFSENSELELPVSFGALAETMVNSKVWKKTNQ